MKLFKSCTYGIKFCFSSIDNPNVNSAVWNAMIAPLTKISLRGVIWSQGESNVDYNSNYYACHITTMVQDWKDNFQDANVPMDELQVAFPFGIVQVNKK